VLIDVVDDTSVFEIVLKISIKLKEKKLKSFIYGGIVSLTVSLVL
jgi:hypothetical protein